MCNSVHYLGREYATPQQLAELVGSAEALVWQRQNPFSKWPEGEDWHRLDLCLCPIDLGKTLTTAVFKWRLGDDPMEWHIERGDA